MEPSEDRSRTNGTSRRKFRLFGFLVILYLCSVFAGAWHWFSSESTMDLRVKIVCVAGLLAIAGVLYVVDGWMRRASDRRKARRNEA